MEGNFSLNGEVMICGRKLDGFVDVKIINVRHCKEEHQISADGSSQF